MFATPSGFLQHREGMLRRRSAGVSQSDTHVFGPNERKVASTSKLGVLFKSSAPALEDALDDFESTSKLAQKWADVQRRGADRFSQWARRGGNAAIDDIAERIRDLLHLHAEQQSKLSEEISNYVQHLRKMNDAEKEVKEAERKLIALQDKEKKMEKDLHRLQHPGLFSRGKAGDSTVIRQHLRDIIQQREKAEHQLADTRAECEVVKMYRFRYGMKGLADSYVDYSERTQDIFGCHREITELVPAIATEDVRYMKYEGAVVSRDRVEQLRRSLEPRTSHGPLRTSPIAPHSQLVGPPQIRRRSEPLRMGSSWERHHGTPPPPYSPGNLPFTSR